MSNRRCLIPFANQWDETADRNFGMVVSGFTSIVQHARRYRANNPEGVVVQAWNPMLVHYKFGLPDPWAKTGPGSWWLLFGDPKNPLSPDALLRYYVMKNAEAGVDLLWRRHDNPAIPVGPLNESDTMGRWLPSAESDDAEEGWTCPLAVWEETAGLTFPQIAALSWAKCIENPSYAEVINGGLYIDDTPGINHPWGSWDSEAGGLPRYGDGGPHDTYHSPIADGTHDFFAKLAELGVLDRFEYRLNAYGNSPSRGNLGQWPIDPDGYKLESFLDQGGMTRLSEGNPNHLGQYLGPIERTDSDWPNWVFGYRWIHQKMGTAKSIVQIGRIGAGDPAHWRRWAIGAALLFDAQIALGRSWTDYEVPSAAECPEYWAWTENVVPTSDAELRTLRTGRTLWLRAYADVSQRWKKKLLVVNPNRAEEVGGIPPEDARLLELWTMGFPEIMRWNAALEGLQVRSLRA